MRTMYRIPETFKENDGFDFNTGNNSCSIDLTDPYLDYNITFLDLSLQKKNLIINQDW